MKKLESGYHEIHSLFQAINLFDRLFFSFSQKDEIHFSGIKIPTDETNLIFKAVQLFRKKIDIPPISVFVEKKIPLEAGLGGGSSNAATTLFAINEMMQHPLSIEELKKIGAEIGSDVPFFFSNGTAIVKGRGEIIEESFLTEPIKGWIAKPCFGLSTKRVYENFKPLPLSRPSQYFNELEKSAFEIEPKLISIKNALEKNFRYAVMTGSGSAFFCIDGIKPSIHDLQWFAFQSIQRKIWY